MSGTLQTLLERHAPLLGRRRELELLLELAERDRPIAAVVHGIAGVGKSTLLRRFAADVPSARPGAAVLLLDCRTIEPTERGFLAALSGALAEPVATPDDVAGALRRRGGRIVIALDAYEVFHLLDTWVRHTLLPGLPDEVRLVVASREAPIEAWRAQLGSLLRTVHLDGLAPADARELLEGMGLRREDAEAVNAFAHGHPLSLQLAGAALAERPGLLREDAALPSVDALAAIYLDGLDPATRRALDAASVTRRTTLSLLEAMLPGEPPGEAFARLRALPFVELGREGLVVGETLREVVAALLRAADPPTYRRLRIAAWRQLRRELREAGPGELWRYTADMLYLVENPAVREAFFPTTPLRHAIEPARPDDLAGIEAISRAHEPEAAVALLRRWWELAPETFTVARDHRGVVLGFYILAEPGDVPVRLLDEDPVARSWRAHLRRAPVGRGQRVLFVRTALLLEGGAMPAPGEPGLSLDLKRTYLELRPALRRVYGTSIDLAAMAPMYASLGFVELPEARVEIDGVAYHAFCNDFGPGSVDGWLTELGARELALDADSVLDPAQRQLVLDGRRVDLTQLEFALLRHLHEREDRVVERDTLLREVWGHEWTGHGNVIEVVVSALRRKLGDRAGALETVRGVGYRLRPLA